MKKTILLMLYITLIFVLTTWFSEEFSERSLWLAENTYFARVEQENIVLYNEATESSQQLFIVPKTYFVELIGKENEEFYYCRYSDIYGYIKISDVKAVANTPQNPFADNLALRVFTPGGANVRSTPYSNLGASNILITAGYLDNNFVFYNYCYGEEVVPRKGNIWYYCKYLNNNNTYFGYVYSAFCDVSEIPDNTEIVEYLSYEPFFYNSTSDASTSEFETMNNTTKTILIIVACLPCFVIIYLLAKPTRLANTNGTDIEQKRPKRNQKQKIRRLKHSDYYEIDDDFFN